MSSENKQGIFKWGMIACCAVMLLAVLALANSDTGISSYSYLLLLLCPVMHLAMCKWMHAAQNPRKPETPRRLPSAADETDRGRA